MSGCYRFEGFLLDAANRQLLRDGAPVELNSRYLDALALLAGERGNLISKERFLEEVWRGVPVTDEALTQCIKTLRKALGDDAANPRFIETVPKHGYRFIAAVDQADRAASTQTAPPGSVRETIMLGGAGLVGGGVAGLIGGTLYGVIGAPQGGMGAISALLVLAAASAFIGLLAGAGVGFGIAIAIARNPWRWAIIGGAAGGLLIGAIVKLIGLDAFTLLLGQSPGDIAGAAEGALLGGAVGAACWWVSRAATPSTRRMLIVGGGFGAFAGALIALIGGRLMAGSLDLLSEHFPSSRLNLDQIGAFFGETQFGSISLAVTTTFEAALFGACMTLALMLARKRLARP